VIGDDFRAHCARQFKLTLFTIGTPMRRNNFAQMTVSRFFCTAGIDQKRANRGWVIRANRFAQGYRYLPSRAIMTSLARQNFCARMLAEPNSEKFCALQAFSCASESEFAFEDFFNRLRTCLATG